MQAIIVGLIIPCVYIGVVLMRKRELLNIALCTANELERRMVTEQNANPIGAKVLVHSIRAEYRKKITFWYAVKDIMGIGNFPHDLNDFASK